MSNSDQEISINETPEFKLISLSSMEDSALFSSSKKPIMHSEQKQAFKIRNNPANDHQQELHHTKTMAVIDSLCELVSKQQRELEEATKFNYLLACELRTTKQFFEYEIRKRCFDSNLMLKFKSPLFVLYEKLCVYHGLPVNLETMNSNIQELSDRYTQSCHTQGCTFKCNEHIEQLNKQLEESKKFREKVVGGFEEIIACLADKINSYEKLLNEKQKKELGVDVEKMTVKNLISTKADFIESSKAIQKKIDDFKIHLQAVKVKFKDHNKTTLKYSQLLTKLKIMRMKFKSEFSSDGFIFHDFKADADAYWESLLSFYIPQEKDFDDDFERIILRTILYETYVWLQLRIGEGLMSSFNDFTHRKFENFEKACKYMDGYNFAVSEFITETSEKYESVVTKNVFFGGIDGFLSAIMQRADLNDLELMKECSVYGKLCAIIQTLFSIDINGNC